MIDSLNSNPNRIKKKVPETWKEEIEKGYKSAMDTVAKHDGTKGYFLNRRVHHGLLGGGLFFFGLSIDPNSIITTPTTIGIVRSASSSSHSMATSMTLIIVNNTPTIRIGNRTNK